MGFTFRSDCLSHGLLSNKEVGEIRRDVCGQAGWAPRSGLTSWLCKCCTARTCLLRCCAFAFVWFWFFFSFCLMTLFIAEKGMCLGPVPKLWRGTIMWLADGPGRRRQVCVTALPRGTCTERSGQLQDPHRRGSHRTLAHSIDVQHLVSFFPGQL